MRSLSVVLFLSLLACNKATPSSDSTGSNGVTGATGAMGLAGAAGPDGAAGATGQAGISCWDLNGNGACDNGEDQNADGVCTAADCVLVALGPTGPTGGNGDVGATGGTGGAGATGATGASGSGATGSTGATGADATSVLAYGDGSAGSLTLSGPVDWSTTPPANDNYQFTDLTSSGALTVASGTVIRCTGTFTNTGTIIIKSGTPAVLGRNAERALSRAAPAAPAGGLAIARADAVQLLRPLGMVAGAGNSKGASLGGDGGGVFVLRALTGIVNQGVITAPGGLAVSVAGSPGSGGGAGGLIVLMSRGSIDNSIGTLRVRGGQGSPPGAGSNGGAGGGGGGGVVYLLAPNAAAPGGTLDVGGNTPGAGTGSAAGGGGGAFGGDGGSGSDSDAPAVAASAGASGLLLQVALAVPDHLLF